MTFRGSSSSLALMASMASGCLAMLVVFGLGEPCSANGPDNASAATQPAAKTGLYLAELDWTRIEQEDTAEE